MTSPSVRQTPVDIERRAIDTIRLLALDAVQRAGSGHPGTAMALAPVAYVLYRERLRHHPGDPAWPDRDRFVLSAGHACMLQYAALHLSGYDLTLDDLRDFRQLGTRTPGHPEREAGTPGIEITTGPLGQGLGNAVGMALAERMMAARFNRRGLSVVDHRTYALCSDGDMMEGVSGEASSLAGHLALDKLCVIYDDNRITIEGSTDLAFTEDVPRRYESYGWHVQRLDDGWRLDDLRTALDAAEDSGRPSLIALRTHIAAGAPHAQDTAEAHGTPLGEDEVRLTKEAYGWDRDATFVVPDAVRLHMDRRDRGRGLRSAWDTLIARYNDAHPELGAEFRRVISGALPDGWDAHLDEAAAARDDEATRVSSGRCINALASTLPELVGGSADLGPSNNTAFAGDEPIAAGHYGGRTLHFGVREHAMGAITNGVIAHGGLRPFGATFLVFSDYMRPSVRLAALMGLPAIYVWTHDSIALGEDGPTHQPVEQLLALRTIPGLRVIRPADAAETAEAWRHAIARIGGPTGIVLSRQKVPNQARDGVGAARGLHRGGYTFLETDGIPDVIAIASGAEVHDAVRAAQILADDGIRCRVVSMPCPELFLAQPAAYRDRILPPAVVTRVSIEAAVTLGWERIVGEHGRSIGVDRFGASAPGEIVLRDRGITAEAVAAAAHRLLGESHGPGLAPAAAGRRAP